MRIIVTGSSSGVGHALASELLDCGNEVWGIARSEQSSFAAQHPGRFNFSCGDVADWRQMQRIAQELASRWLDVDGLITCAGVQGEIGSVLSADPERWSSTIRVNLDGTFYAIRAFAGILRKATHHAKIICFSGGGATKSRPNFSAYGVAKTGVVRLVETVADELRGQPVDINAVAPGAINTRLTDEVISLGPGIVGETEFKAALKQKSDGGFAIDRTVALVKWLLSSQSDGISGKLISAPWDPWQSFDTIRDELMSSDIYTLRRIVPEDRGKSWSK